METKVWTNDSSFGSGDGSRLQVLLPCQVAMEKCGTAVATGSRGPDANALAMHQFTGVPAGSRVGCQVGLPP